MTDALASPSPIKLRWAFALVVVFLIFVVIATYSSRMAQDTTGYDYQRAAERKANLDKLRADDEKTLTTADWIDQTKGIVRIPIDEAMPETVIALQAKPARMGAAIPGTAPVKANTVPASAANAAPAGSPQAAPSTNAASAQPPAPTSGAPNK
jgi:hypothetical protein